MQQSSDRFNHLKWVFHVCFGIISWLGTSPAWSGDIPTQTFNAGSTVQIVADDTEVRPASESLLLGFNMPWNAVQGHGTGDGIWDEANRQVEQGVIDFLKANCRDNVYRYPGGTVTTTFNWKDSIGQPASRTAQWVSDWSTSVVPDFGFDEFMSFVEQVGGRACLTINMSLTAQDAADWVEYCNSPNDGSNPGGGTDWAAVRASNGHAVPYNVNNWELGNELDKSSWTTQQYIDAAVPIILAMRAVTPAIRIIAHASTADFLQNPSTWYDWHRTLLDDATLNPLLTGLALHTYYDGYDVEINDSIHAKIVVDDADPLPVWITEHAKWPASLSDQTSWPSTSGMSGAISSADMLLAYNHHANIEMALLHALGGTGPWRPFNGIDSETGKYNNDIAIRPLPYALGLLNKYLPGKAVLNTTMSTPNAPSYSGGYDVRGVALRDADNQSMYVAAINRCYNINYPAHVSLPGLEAGHYLAMRECVGGDDAGISGVVQDFFNIKVTANNDNGDFIFPLPHRSVVVVRPLASNLLLTPDMETDSNSDGMPDNWGKRTASGTTGTISLQNDNTALDGSRYVRLTKSSGTGSVSCYQSSGQNSELAYNGFVGQNVNDYFMATASVRADTLDASGGLIRLQLFEKNALGQSVFVAGLNSAKVTGSSNGWVTLTSPIFRPADYIHEGCTFNYMEINLQILSSTGSVDFDSVGLIHLSNRLTNASFENDFDLNGMPDNWDKRFATGTTGTVEQLYGSDAEEGGHYVCLTKTGGTGAVSIAQSSWNNSHLGVNGFVACHTRESFVASAFLRGNNLDASGAKLRIQIFQKNQDGAVTYVQSIYSSTAVTGTTDWTQVAIPAFRPSDYLSPGCTLAKLEIIVQTVSITGSVDVDDVNFYLQP